MSVNIIGLLGQVGDAFFSAVSLLLHMNGTNGSTAFMDSSVNGFTGTAVGNAQLSTSSPKYGTACGLFDGAGDWVTFADNSLLQMGSGDFTMEFWVNYASFSSGWELLSKGLAGAGSFRILSAITTGVLSVVIAGGVAITEAGSRSTATWYHYALVRKGTALTLYRDGVSVGSAVNSTNLNDTGLLFVGGGSSASSVNASMDDVRITKGVARYIAAFTPPAAAFPDPY